MQLAPIIRGHDRRTAGQPSACRVGMCASVFELVCRDPRRCWIGSGFVFRRRRGKSEDMHRVHFLLSHPVLQTAVQPLTKAAHWADMPGSMWGAISARRSEVSRTFYADRVANFSILSASGNSLVSKRVVCRGPQQASARRMPFPKCRWIQFCYLVGRDEIVALL
jgi:hypothetical protein